MRISENDIIDIIEGVVRRYNLISESKSRYESMARKTLREMFEEDPHFRDRMASLMRWGLQNPAVEENPRLKAKLQELMREYERTNNIDILVGFWYGQFRGSIPYMHTNAVYFLPGCIKLFREGYIQTASSFSLIGRIAYYLIHLEGKGGYNSFFSKNGDDNPESFYTLDRETAPGRARISRLRRKKVKRMEFEEGKHYEIVPISGFSDARRYGAYTNWCICHDRMNWDQYTSDDNNTVYFMLADGWKDTPRRRGENYPFDDYGQSMISIIVFPDGDLAWSTCRWNEGETHGDISKRHKKCPDLLYSETELSKLIGKDFYQTFHPKGGPLNHNDDDYDDSDEDIENVY